MKRVKLDTHVDKDVVLCRSYNRTASRLACKQLLSDSIPYTMSSKRIPIFLRGTYHADEILTISINRNLYSKARRSIDSMDMRQQKRLLMNYI